MFSYGWMEDLLEISLNTLKRDTGMNTENIVTFICMVNQINSLQVLKGGMAILTLQKEVKRHPMNI